MRIIIYSNTTEQEFQQVCQNIATLTQDHILDLTCSAFQSPNRIIQICQALAKNSGITELSLRDIEPSDEICYALEAEIPEAQCLTDARKKVQMDLAQFANSLAENQTLTTLDLRSNWLTKETATIIGDALVKNKHIKELYLGPMPVVGFNESPSEPLGEADVIEPIFAALIQNRTLTLLSVREASLTQRAVDLFQRMLLQNQSLIALELPELIFFKADSDVLLHVATAIGECFAHNTTLRDVNLNKIHIGNPAQNQNRCESTAVDCIKAISKGFAKFNHTISSTFYELNGKRQSPKSKPLAIEPVKPISSHPRALFKPTKVPEVKQSTVLSCFRHIEEDIEHGHSVVNRIKDWLLNASFHLATSVDNQIIVQQLGRLLNITDKSEDVYEELPDEIACSLRIIEQKSMIKQCFVLEQLNQLCVRLRNHSFFSITFN